MPQIIEDYQYKTNKELLIELVVQGNSTVAQGKQIVDHLDRLNGSVARNTERSLDNHRILKERTVPAWMQSRWKVAGLSTLALSTASAIAVGIAELIKCMG